jgi:hypothetical protein
MDHKPYVISTHVQSLVPNVYNLVYHLALLNSFCKFVNIFVPLIKNVMEQNLVGFPNSMYLHVGPYTPYFGYGYGGIKNAPSMWPPMSNPLTNPITPPKPILEITQNEIVADCGEPLGEDDDFHERKHNPKMPIIIPIKKPYHGRKIIPSYIKNVGGPLIGGWIAPISNDGGGPFDSGGNGPLGGGGGGPSRSGNNEPLGNQNPKSYVIGPVVFWIRPTWNPWYLSWCLIQPPITPNPPPSRKSLFYPIYIVGTNIDAHVPVFHKAIQANGDKNDIDVINILCFTYHDAISKWGIFFMRTHLIHKFKELEAAFCKCY